GGFSCKVCDHAKMARMKFAKIKDWGANLPGDVVHSDVCGKIKPQSIGGMNYFVTVIDEYSDYKIVKTIRKKSEVFDYIQEVRSYIKTQTDNRVKILVS